MADNTLPIPDGATVGEDSNQSSSLPIPQGAQVGEQSTLSKVGQFGTDLMSGIGEGALDTVHGTGEILRKVGNYGSRNSAHPGEGDRVIPPVGQNALEHLATPENTVQKVGYGGENLMEFLMGDEALKGLSLAEKLAKSGQIAKALEGSPRLMKMLQLGANIGKAQSTLGPEERALVTKYPVIARLVGLGMDSLRAGVTQGAQTTVKSGGDVKEAAKEGTEVAAGGAALGAPLETLGGVLSKATNARSAATRLAQTGANAPEKADAVNAVRGWIDEAEKKMHGDFEIGIEGMKDDLKGETIKPEESALSKKSQELLQTTPGEGPKLAQELSGELKGIVPGTERTEGLLNTLANPVREEETTVSPRDFLREAGADRKSIMKTDADKATVEHFRELYKNGKDVEAPSILKDAQGNVLEADGRHRALAAQLEGKATIPIKRTTRMSDFDIDGLIDLRQKLGQKARELPYGDPNARRLRQLQHAVDDDVQTMAGNADKPEVAKNYQNLRADYRTKLADIESTPIDKLRANEPGKELNDVGQYVLSGANSKAKIETLRRVIGPDRLNMVSDSIATNWLRDATNDTGQLDPKKFLDQYTKVKPDVRNTLFAGRPAVKLNEFVTDATTARTVQKAVKAGVVTVGGGLIWGPAGALLSLLFAKDKTAAGSIMDYVVDHPAMWKSLDIAGKAASNSTTRTATKVAAKTAVTGVIPSLQSVYAGANPGLGGQVNP